MGFSMSWDLPEGLINDLIILAWIGELILAYVRVTQHTCMQTFSGLRSTLRLPVNMLSGALLQNLPR
jgi:hypothetical protein